MLAFELNLDAIPEPKRKATKTKPALALSALMPLSRDFAFLVDQATPAGEIVRPILAADKALIAAARVFDVYQGKGVPEGQKSVAVEVTVQPTEKTLTDAEIEALSGRIVAAADKAVGAKLRELSSVCRGRRARRQASSGVRPIARHALEAGDHAPAVASRPGKNGSSWGRKPDCSRRTWVPPSAGVSVHVTMLLIPSAACSPEAFQL